MIHLLKLEGKEKSSRIIRNETSVQHTLIRSSAIDNQQDFNEVFQLYPCTLKNRLPIVLFDTKRELNI